MSSSNNFSPSTSADLPSKKSVLRPDYKDLPASLSKKEKLDIICKKNSIMLLPPIDAGLGKIQHRGIVNAAGEVEGVNSESSPNRKAAKGVPNFWLIVLKNTQLFKDLSYRDERALSFLKDIKSTKVDKNGFKLEFFFDPNPYFKNYVISKTYYMNDEEDKREIFWQAIDWFPSQCLTERLSFFDFFETASVPIDENDAIRFHNFMERELDVGVYIRDKVIPKALCWFTGDVKEVDFLESDAETDYGSDVSYTSTSESEDDEVMSRKGKKICRSWSRSP